MIGTRGVDEVTCVAAGPHRREIPEVILTASQNVNGPDRRVLKMLGARGSHVAAEPSLREEVATITAA